MSIPGDASPLLLGGGAQQYKIERSLRFNSSDSAYLSRTPASAGNTKTWTWSGWVKLSTSQGYIFGASSDNWSLNYTTIQFNGTALRIEGNNATHNVITANIFRDYSAWAHITVAFDTTQATAANRIRAYVNGTEVVYSTASYPPQNSDTLVNAAVYHQISGRPAGNFFNGYLADVHLIDGQALTPSSFAETNATTGQWVPKAYTGTYGTNGFRLAFADNSNNTATTLGKDSSPNGNNWTPNNLSVTAGAGNDSLVDTPTSYGTDTGAGGEVRGNYATLNPLNQTANLSTVSEGNLYGRTTATSDYFRIGGTIFVSSGKWYYEYTPSELGIIIAGVATNKDILNQNIGSAGVRKWGYYYTGTKFGPGVFNVAYGASYAVNDVIGVTLDMNAGTLTFYKNGVSQGTAFTDLLGYEVTAFFDLSGFGGGTNTGAVFFNFGQRPFAYTAPSGFKALCDTNLPAPVVAKPNTAFDVALWTGNGSARSITGLNFNPDFVWIKGRSGATDHALYDVVRGTEKRLESNTTDAEVTSDGGVTAFNSDGFSLGTLAQVNTNSSTYVGWAWDGGTSTVTNTQGSITSQVRANASAGFSIVTFTMGSGSFTVGHGLGVAPSLLVTKARSNTSSWWTYHVSLGTGSYLALNSTAAAATDYSWGNAPTSAVFTANNNFFSNTFTYVVYAFAPVAGYSSFGSYTGNGSADGPFVYTGFRPALVIVKMSSSTGNWTILDYQRQGYNVDNDPLFPNLGNGEGTTDLLDLTSNGFKVRTTDATFNTNAGTYVYAAWAQNPFQYARAR